MIKSPNSETLDRVIDWTNGDLFHRNLNLLKIFESEWVIIGKMKKELEKLVDNCRICEKKVKVHNLIEHSKYCEKDYELKAEMRKMGMKFVEKAMKFYQVLVEEESKSNIGSM